jgi:hypothetical protein
MTFREWWESEAYCIALPSRTAPEGTTEALICAVAGEAWKAALQAAGVTQPPEGDDLPGESFRALHASYVRAKGILERLREVCDNTDTAHRKGLERITFMPGTEMTIAQPTITVAGIRSMLDS